MGKTVEEICNEIINNRGERMPKFKTTSRTLSSCLECNIPNNPYGSIALYSDEGLYDKLERIITQKLADAIDQNSPYKIKQLKEEYGHLKEFANAKKYLNQKSKEIWNVYAKQKNVPKDAMKALGISNCPDLDSLLYSCIKCFEQDGKNTTAIAIDSILNNENMSYTMEDIHKYLETMHKSKAVEYNFNTIRYLIYKHHYEREKLASLGVEKEMLNKVLKDLPLKIRLKFLFKK
jgi:hypothetical protein